MIYEIVCNETNERYIGSTFEPTLSRRLSCHKADAKRNSTCMSKQIIDRGNYYINLLEKIDVNTRDELRMKERYWYDKLDCINKVRSHITKIEKIEYQKKYHEEHRQIKREQSNKYYYDNRDKINAKRKELYALKILDPAKF